MAGGGLHILQARAVIERSGDKRRAHGMGRVSPTESNGPRVLPEDPVNQALI
jgi:hypothetical protein